MPVFEVEAPDGNTYEVDAPEGATEQQILQYAKENYQQATVEEASTEPDLADQVSGIFQKRQGIVQEGWKSYMENPNKRTGTELIGDVLGNSAMAGLETVGTVIVEGLKTVAENSPQELNDAVQAGWETFVNAVPAEIKQGLSSATESTLDAYNSLEEKYPREMRQVNNIAALLMATTPKNAPNPAAKPTAIGKVGNKLERLAKKQQAGAKRDKIVDLIRETPRKEFDVVKDVGRTREVGLLRKQEKIVTQAEKKVARDVSKVKGINPDRSFTYNSNRITDGVDDVANNLRNKLDNLPEPKGFLIQDAYNKIDDNLSKLFDEEIFLTENRGAVNKLIEKSKSILANSDNSANSLWDARIQFDNWVKSQKGKFPDKAGVFDEVNRTIRDSINDVIIQEGKRGGLNVGRELSKYSNLKQAQKSIALKAHKEGANAVVRQMARLKDIVGARNETLALIATGMGTTFLAASQTAAAPVAGAIASGVALRGAYNAIKTPQFKKSLAALLKLTDQGIKTATNPSMIRELRADRAILVQLMENIEKDDTEVVDAP